MPVLFSKNALSPILSIVLLLFVVMALISVLFYMTDEFVSENTKAVDSRNTQDRELFRIIENNDSSVFVENYLEDVNMTRVSIDGNDCNIETNYSSEFFYLNISDCITPSMSSTPQIRIESEQGFYEGTLRLSSRLKEACIQDGKIVYNGNSAEFFTAPDGGGSCNSEARTCDNSNLLGNSTYQYRGCNNESASAQDTFPDTFSFADKTNVSTSTLITSNNVTPSGYEGPLSVSVSGDGSPQIRINESSWTTSTSMSPGDDIETRLNSSSSYSTQSQATITLGGYSTTWSVTTEDDPLAAAFDACAFKDDKTGCESYYETKTIGGINIVHDTILGLYWQQNPDSTTRTWSTAQSYCSGLGTGWRLPTLVEMEASLVDTGRSSSPYIVGGTGGSNLFSNVQSNYYWTDTRYSSFLAYRVRFNDGRSGFNGVTNSHYVFCVKTAP